MRSVRRSRAAGARAWLALVIALLAATAARAQNACPATPPTLIAPADNASAVSSPVEFRWNALATGGAELIAYRVHVYLQSGEDVVVAETKETMAIAPLPPGTHRWAVEAALAGCPSLVSAKNGFSVTLQTCPQSGPQLLAPPDGATGVASPVTFSWGEVPGAPAYRLMTSIDGGEFQPLVTQARTATVLLPPKPIAWFVDTALEGCPPVASPTFHLTVSGTTCPTKAPELVVPPAGATIARGVADPPIELVWTAVPDAVGYTLELIVTYADRTDRRTIGDLKQPIFVAEGVIDLRNSAVEWFVRASFEGGCGPTESEHRQFTVTTPAGCALSPPAAIAPPPDSTTGSPVTHFAWSASPDAAEYRVWIKPEGLEPRVAAVTHGALEIDFVLDFGRFEWFVEAFREGCAPASSPPSRFTIERSANCETTPPRGVHPSPGETGLVSPIQFSWEAAKGAVGYTVFLSHQGGRPTPLFDPKRPGELITTTSLTADVPPGESIWFVEAIFSGCPPASSEPIPFTLTGCDVGPPLLANPRPGARVTAPVDLLWTPVRDATSYEVFASVDGAPPESLGTRPAPGLLAHLKTGGVVWWVASTIAGCGAVRSPESAFVVIDTPACGTPDRPHPAAPGQVSSKAPYRIRWDPVPNAGSYEIEEALTPDFASATNVTATIGEAEFSHDVVTDTAYYYRIRAVSSCGSATSESSAAARVIVLGPTSSSAPMASADAGSSQALLKSVFIPGGTAGRTFKASSTSPWISLPVTEGTIPAEGLTLSFTVDPASLPFGTNQGDIKVELAGGGSGKSGGRESLDTTGSVTVPVTVTLVTPVTKAGKSAPPSDALIIPAVIHASGGYNSKWVSDVRVLNASAQATQVQVTFTPTLVDGTATGYKSTLSIGAGETTALDAILKEWFGLASLGELVSGSLEIRPLTTTSSNPLGGKKTLPVIGSSRTYNDLSTGTFGQFMPAFPFGDFVGGPSSAGASATKLSIQQIAQSSVYRTNLGIVEGSGEAAAVTIAVFDRTGTKLTTLAKSLVPGQHMQLNSVLQGLSVDDGRFEVEVTSGNGKVYAYASLVDNRTNDPMLIRAVNLDEAATDHQVLAGIADYDTGAASWRSDVRLYNAGASAETATLTFYPTLDPSSSKAIQVTLDPGEVEQLDDILASDFAATNTGGAIHITTAAEAKLVASARTYNLTANGTFGQFIPAFREQDGISKGDPPLQILQLEHSTDFRTNIGLFEMSGKAGVTTVEITAVVPGSRVTAKMPVELDPYEFTQLIGPLKAMGIGTAYNTRVSIRVKDGDGTVAAYASVIDESTQDPIYVPSQQ